MNGEHPVLIMAGGTGGHIFPGLAVADELKRRRVPVAWLGSSGGMEADLVPRHAVPFNGIAVSRLRGQRLTARLAAPLGLSRAVAQAFGIIRRLSPRAVLAMGGFAAGPGGVAAWLQRIPLLVHEQNRVPGLTNRILARLARRIMAGFPDAFGPERKALYVGNPVRSEIAALAPPEDRFARRDGPPRLLVLGGSQGALRLNQVVPEALALMSGSERPQVRHQVGRRHRESTVAVYGQAGVDAEVVPFIDDMAGSYGWADLVLARAGALTLAEIAAAGVGSILVPFPYAVDDHQTRNAAFLVAVGAGELIPEDRLTARLLAGRLSALMSDRSRLLEMAERARSVARPDAAARVADQCLEVAR